MFRVSSAPQFSSAHYYFKWGFSDVEEYWSFELPPEDARTFLDSYIKEHGFTAIEDPADAPQYVLGKPENPNWLADYWFPSLNDVDEAHVAGNLFCAYSKDANRVYLANWDE